MAAFLVAAFFGVAFFAGAGALRFLVTRPVLVLPRTFGVSVTAGACSDRLATTKGSIVQERLTGAGILGALRLLAVLAVGLALVVVFFVVVGFFAAAAFVAFLGAPTFFLGAASLTAESFLVAVFCFFWLAWFSVGTCLELLP